MKKSLIYIFAAASLLCSCDPVNDARDLDVVSNSKELLDGTIFEVYKDEALTQKAGPAEGTWVKFYTQPSMTVCVYNYDAEGNEKVLATGTAGSFQLALKRGSSTDQVLHVRTVNSDNSVIETTKTVSVWVKADLDPELKLLLGESGVKKWGWDYTSGASCWGNGGASTGAEYTEPRVVGGHWWGVARPEQLGATEDDPNGQLAHTDTKMNNGDESSKAYMVFDEDGKINTFNADGKIIRKGTYEIKDWDPSRSSGWQIAKLVTSEPAVLFPFSINENGKTVTEFDVMYLDANHMTLVYTKGNAAGSWGEITHWLFKNMNAEAETLQGSDGRKWYWAADGYEFWGNAGNSGNGAGYGPNDVDGKWWGVKSGDELLGQLQHSGGVAYGDEDSYAYMIFKDGKVTSYKPDGTEIRSGWFAIDMTEESRTPGWNIGKLTTTAPALLFPWSINEGGKAVTEFDIMYMDADNMTLVYTKGNGAGSWGEITYWRFWTR